MNNMQNIVYVITKIDWSDSSTLYKPIWKICRTLMNAIDIVDKDLLDEGYVNTSFNLGNGKDIKYRCSKFKPSGFGGYDVEGLGFTASYSVTEMELSES